MTAEDIAEGGLVARLLAWQDDRFADPLLDEMADYFIRARVSQHARGRTTDDFLTIDEGFPWHVWFVAEFSHDPDPLEARMAGFAEEAAANAWAAAANASPASPGQRHEVRRNPDYRVVALAVPS